MRLMVIDTALGACTAAVFEDDRALAVRFEPMTKGHQERIGGLVRDVMAEAGGGFGGKFGRGFRRWFGHGAQLSHRLGAASQLLPRLAQLRCFHRSSRADACLCPQLSGC